MSVIKVSLGCHFCGYLVTIGGAYLCPLGSIWPFSIILAAQNGYISNSGAGVRFMQMIQGVCRSSLGQVHYLNNSGSASRSTMLVGGIKFKLSEILYVGRVQVSRVWRYLNLAKVPIKCKLL